MEGQPPVNLQFRLKDRSVKKVFSGTGVHPSIVYHTIQQRSIRSIELIKENRKPLIIFIHGAPGSSADFYTYLQEPRLIEAANMIATDRPGYGYSDFGKSVTSIPEQANVIASIIQLHKKDRQVLVVGHSYGGPIALQLAADHNYLVNNVILLAPAIDPDCEKFFKIAYLANKKPMRWFIPMALRVAADEKFSHQDELLKLQSKLRKIHQGVCHIHGTSDRLVPFKNLKYAQKWLTNTRLETIILEKENHFIPWTQKQLITKKIIEMCQGTSNEP